jgi:excisionase family DNA binding protein
MTTRRPDPFRLGSPADGSAARRATTSDGDQSHPGVLYTPTEAAERLAIPESWLRRKAGQRLIPCTKLGKHLRFSPNDLARIARDGAQAARTVTVGHRFT